MKNASGSLIGIAFIYKFNAIPVKTPARFFVYIHKWILKLIWKDKGTRIAIAILILKKKKKSKVGGHTLLNIKIYCKATIIKTMWYWRKDRYTD